MKEAFQHHWYIAATSEELAADALLPRTILSDDYVLFRDGSGTAHAIRNQCPHRGARLSDGNHTGDGIACPFHGWQFGGDGICRHIPANGPGAAIPSGARTTSCPVRESNGFIWVYLGSPDRFTELALPSELTDPDYKSVPFTARWQAHITRIAESVIDVSHLPFVHPGTTGVVDPIVRDGPEFTVTDEEICVVARPFHPLVDTPLTEDNSRGFSTITLTYPNQLMLRTDVHGQMVATYLSLTPVGDAETIIYGLALRNFFVDVEMLDEIHYEHNVTVLDEDRPVVEGLRPQQSPLDLKAEQHVRSDAQQIRYRLMVKKRLTDGGIS